MDTDIMENRSLALRYLSEALSLDKVGDCQVALGKYLESLHVLTLYMKEMLAALGFQNMVEKNGEIKSVLKMVKECSERIAIIVDINSSKSINVKKRESISGGASNEVVSRPSKKFPAFEKLQAENTRILKQYQWRCERTNDYREKTNLRLELERKLVENAVIAKQKYNMAVKQLQKERLHMMEQQMKALLDNQHLLTQQQKDKQELYQSVFQHTKTEMWTFTWQLNSAELSTEEATQQIFQKTIKCNHHPLSEWILKKQKIIRTRIEGKLKEYSDYKDVPDLLTDESIQDYVESSSSLVIRNERIGTIRVSKQGLKYLFEHLEKFSSELSTTIETALEVFYLIYKSLLPEDSEEFCYKLIEAHILEPIWPSFILLFRISNILSEYKISKIMKCCEASNPRKFGVTNQFIDTEVWTECITDLKKLPDYMSLTEKLKILVELCQAICGTSSPTSENQRKLGADDLIPLLCYVIVKAGLPQLCSECYTIEQLFNMKYSFGEEGYALSSFLTALKYIEFRMGVDDYSEAL